MSISISRRTSCTKSLSFKEMAVFQAGFWFYAVSVGVLDVTVLITTCGDSIVTRDSAPFQNILSRVSWVTRQVINGFRIW
jgi:hypothetical protein